MNAQDAYNTAQAINQDQKILLIKTITSKIKLAAEKGLFSIFVSLDEVNKVKNHFEALGYRISNWGDQRDGDDYRISWEKPK